MIEISWESCDGARECLASLIVHPLTIVILIPTLAVFFGGLVKWILAGGRAIRDYFLVGVEVALTSLVLAFTSMFDWVRRAVVTPDGEALEYPPQIFAGSIALVSVVVLLFVIALMGAYVDKRAPKGTPSITWLWFWLINGMGAAPLGIAAVLLIG